MRYDIVHSQTVVEMSEEDMALLIWLALELYVEPLPVCDSNGIVRNIP